MQDKNHADTKKILLMVATHLGVKGIRGLANALGEKENKIYAWINRGTIGDAAAILSKCPEIRPEWLKTGEGEMLREQPRQRIATQVESIAAEQAVNDYRSSADRMAVVELKRSISEDGWALLDSFELLCDEQKKSLLIVAQTMALGVPTKSPPKGPGEKS